jgi:hypothetical protein
LRKTRVSTRNRTAKKQPSDYEELASSEGEGCEGEGFEDDEEDDPNFDAQEECKLRRQSTLQGSPVECRLKNTILFNLVQEMKVLKEEEVLKEIISADGVEWKEFDVDELTKDSEGRLVCPQPECGKSFKAPRTLKRHLVAHSLQDSKNKKKVPSCPKCQKGKDSVISSYLSSNSKLWCVSP